jgi:lipid A 4'-phosphatase
MIRRWALTLAALALLVGAVASLWPELDLAAARLFFRDGQWLAAGNPGAEGFRRLAAVLVFGVPLGAVLLWLLLRLAGRPARERAAAGRAALVLVLSLGLGSGLVVNAGFKDHWGRARPSQIVEFGRDRAFTPALLPTDQCRRNCSFASGESAMGFGLVVLALLAPRRRRAWALVPGLVMGGALSVTRMAAGGHFLSDVLFGGLMAAAVGLAVYAVLYRDRPNPDQAARA